MLGEGRLAPHPHGEGTAADQRALLVSGPAVVYSATLPRAAQPSPGVVLRDVSPNVREMLGLDESWTLDSWTVESAAPLIGRIHPDDRRWVLHGMGAARRHGSWVTEYRLRDARGRWLWVRDHMTLMRDEAGTPQAIAGVIVDITEQRSLELTLRREHSHLAELLEMMPVGVVVVDARTGRLLIGGGAIAALVGADHADTHAKQLERYDGYWPGTDTPLRLLDWPLHRTLRSGESLRDVEADVVRMDGSRVTVSMSTTPVVDADGRVVAAAMVFQDITERAANLRRIEHALEAERLAREEAELASATLESLRMLSAEFAAVTTAAQLTQALLGTVREAVGARDVWVGVVQPPAHVSVMASSVASLTSTTRLDMNTPLPGCEAIRTSAAQWVASGEVMSRWPMIRAFTGLHDDAVAAIPLRRGAETFGSVVLRWAPPFDFDPQRRTMLVAVAEVISQAIQRVQLLEHERAVARALQDSMLLQRLPVLEGVELAASYQPASDELEVGGDWYDVIPLPGGRIGVAVGDVMGRGLPAATAMGQLRSALAALALSFSDPADVLERLDAFAQRVDGAWLASVFYGVVDPGRGTLRYCCAGHVPPLIAQPGAPTQTLWDGRAGLLGAPDPGPRRSAERPLAADAVLLLYTDGLVERRGSDITEDCEQLAVTLADAVSTAAPSLEDLCAQLVSVAPAQSDDVAVLAVRLAPGDRIPSFHGTATGVADLASLRKQLRAWLAQLDLTEDEAYDVLLAVGEACANAVEHAYGSGDGPVEVAGVVSRTALELTVSDRGAWTGPPSESQRGQGLLIMQALMEDVSVRATGSGTAVTLGRRLRSG